MQNPVKVCKRHKPNRGPISNEVRVVCSPQTVGQLPTSGQLYINCPQPPASSSPPSKRFMV